MASAGSSGVRTATGASVRAADSRSSMLIKSVPAIVASGRDTVPPLRFRAVERAIGLLENSLGRHRVGVTRERDADRDRESHRPRSGAEQEIIHIRAKAFRETHGTVPRLVREENDEFVTTRTCDGVGIACGRSQNLRELLQYLVTGMMPETVVDFLEVVHVDREHRDTRLRPFRHAPRRHQLALERTAIQAAGEWIGADELGETITHRLEAAAQEREIIGPPVVPHWRNR